MKVTKEQAAENRQRIVDTAAKLFREKGFDGIGVADLMKSAGLTHGGFYGHFSCKDDLMAEACTKAASASIDDWSGVSDDATGNPMDAVVAAYLCPNHRDYPGKGCVVAALGSDAARQSAPVRHAITEGVRAIIEFFTGLLPGKSKAARRKKALATYATLIGALVLARAVDDPELSEEILLAIAASLT